MKEKTIITISREYGSGGRRIGEKLALALGIPYCDKAIIDMAAQKSGFDPEFIASQEQKVTGSLLFTLATTGYYTGESLHDQIFRAECHAILEMAVQGSCVMVGRCADYILKGKFDCFNVFIHADEEFCRARAITEYGVKPAEAAKVIEKINRQRARHYQYYSQQVWGAAKNYHMTLDSGRFGIDGSVEILKSMAELF